MLEDAAAALVVTLFVLGVTGAVVWSLQRPRMAAQRTQELRLQVDILTTLVDHIGDYARRHEDTSLECAYLAALIDQWQQKVKAPSR